MFLLPNGIDGNRVLSDHSFVCFDTETTGIPLDSRVVEIAIVHINKDLEIVREWSTLVNPGCPIPAGAAKVHGISDKMVKNSPSFADIYPEVVGRMRGNIPMVYNLTYDWNILKNETNRLGKKWFQFFGVCPLTLARSYIPNLGSYAQAKLSRELGIHVGDEDHRALSDVYNMINIYKVVSKKLEPGMTIQQLWDRQVGIGQQHERRMQIRFRNGKNDSSWLNLPKIVS